MNFNLILKSTEIYFLYYVLKLKRIDNLINGGILQGEIIELVGSPSTGKTQVFIYIYIYI